jgi:lipopolysaccharide assembly outer membrane protein LptD (OstA)
MSAIYLYERGSPGTEFPESREQISARIAQSIDDNWGVSASAIYDLGEEQGLRQGIVGLSYDDDCFGVTAELQRQLQREAAGKDDLAVLLRFRLKNLGEFETTAYDAGSSDDLQEDLKTDEELGL